MQVAAYILNWQVAAYLGSTSSSQNHDTRRLKSAAGFQACASGRVVQQQCSNNNNNDNDNNNDNNTNDNNNNNDKQINNASDKNKAKLGPVRTLKTTNDQSSVQGLDTM